MLETAGCIWYSYTQLTKIMPVLTPIAAVGFALIMLVAFMIHFKRRAYKISPLFVIVFALSLIVAYFRF
jgi:hypothetical protein